MSMTGIHCKNLHKAFGKQKVLQGLNLFIPQGQTTVILGRSGEGKSVLLKHIIGLLKPDHGTILINDVDISQLSKKKLEETRKQMGYLFQDSALFDDMTVYENISFPLTEHRKYSTKKMKDIVKEKLDIVGLKDIEHKYPNELSGGMRKRVGLARAIALSPATILYDEPTTGLDPLMTAAIDNLIISTAKKLNVTSIVISHDIQSAFRVADRMAMLYKGKIIAQGTKDEFSKITDPLVVNFLNGNLEEEKASK